MKVKLGKEFTTVYQAAIDAAMRIFEITKRFPTEERFSMVDQIRKASRSVCANIGEAWRKRRYPAHFVSKLSDSEGEAEETRVWLDLAFRCNTSLRKRLTNSIKLMMGYLVSSCV